MIEKRMEKEFRTITEKYFIIINKEHVEVDS